ncbi:MAG TPA: ABC transporter substrate-binding protein [Gemmatimonadales bacterium]
MPRFSRRGRHASAVLAPALALGWLAGACAPGTGAAPTPALPAPAAPELPAVSVEQSPGPDPCAFEPSGPLRADTVRVIAGSAFPARQLYQTLIRLDCTGRPRSGLATGWSPADAGRTWVLTLGDARFWDGAAVTAETVATGWAHDSASTAALREAGILFVGASGDRELRILLAAPSDSVPAALADQRLSVMRRTPDSPWPVGTGAYRLPESDPAPATLEPVGNGRPLRLLARPRDLRDAVDAGVDIVVTDDPATLAYVAGRAGFMSLPLPWTRAYGLVLTSANDSSAADVTPAFKETLARDAVRIDARAATAVAAGCPVATLAPNRSAHPGTRIAYRAGDRTAGDLAARLAALGIAGARSVVALDSVALIASLRAGAEVAYVVVLARACDEASRAAGAAVLPLVETRAHAVVRSGAPPLTVDRDGVLRLLPETP